jgi:formylglycine-generating enzyme required for sulfatase activity
LIDPIAWHLCNSELVLHPVGELLPNAYGLYDMLGNAGEWVDDIFNGASLADNEGKSPPLIDPVGYLEDDVSILRCMRGGSIGGESCRCTASATSNELVDLRTLEMGFRPVRTIFDD